MAVDYNVDKVLLADEIIKLVSDRVLIDLTNEEKSASTTLDRTKLEQACFLVLGMFNMKAGQPAILNPVNPMHVAICQDGVIAQLMSAKARSSSTADKYERSFHLKCIDLRKVGYVSPATSSNFISSDVQPNTLKDFDLSREVMAGRLIGPREPSERNNR